jgi:Zn-dependent peptidase ImmA (M78 family)
MPINAAREMLDKHWDKRLPVNPVAIAQAAGVTVYRDPNAGSISGRFEIADGSPRIYVNSHESRLRQRFTIAHELGHFALRHGSRFRDTAGSFASVQIDPVETQANRFAAELLMPAAAINGLIERRGITDFAQLVELFDVSQQAMQFRLKNLGWL